MNANTPNHAVKILSGEKVEDVNVDDEKKLFNYNRRENNNGCDTPAVCQKLFE